MLNKFFKANYLYFKPVLLKALIIFFIALFVSVLVNTFRPNPLEWNWKKSSTVSLISEFEEFDKLLNSSNSLLIDAREDVFYEMGYIPKAINIPANKAEFFFNFEFGQKIKTYEVVIIYCTDVFCNMAETLAEKLLNEYNVEALIFSPGFSGWEEAGREINYVE